jgi:anti-anti-sigma factor
VQSELSVSTSVSNGVVGVVRIRGYLDGGEPEAVDAAIRHLSRWGCRRVVLDLTLVHPVSCRGVRSLLASLERWQRHGLRLIVCGVRPSCRTILDLMGCHSSLEIVHDLAAATAPARASAQREGGRSGSDHRPAVA